MKKLLLVLTSIVLTMSAHAQIVSKANGLFLNPMTWDCNCIPTAGSTIIIKHDVTLNTSWLISNGGMISIDSAASLTQDATKRNIMTQGEAYLFNGGTLDINFLLIQNGGFFNKSSGTAYISSFENNEEFYNQGVIMDVDSFYNTDLLYNVGTISTHTFLNIDTLANGGVINNVDSAFNTGVFYIDESAYLGVTNFLNIGMVLGNSDDNSEGYFYDVANTGTFYIPRVSVTNSVVNTGTLMTTQFSVGNNLANFEKIYSFGENPGLSVANDFSNLDTADHNALVICFEGSNFSVANNFLNVDSIAGDAYGHLEVLGISVNNGKFLGELDFCDLSTTIIQNGGPDLNTGSIDGAVTFCSVTSVKNVSKEEALLYPNPADNFLKISSTGKMEVYSTLGTKVYEGENINEINTSKFSSGIYSVVVTENNGNVTKQKISVIH